MSWRWRRLVAASGVFLVLLGWGCGDEPPEVDTEVLIGGHDEVVVLEDGSLLPLFLAGGKEKITLCLSVEVSEDTTRWEMEMTVAGRPSPSGWVPQSARSGPTVCFAATLPVDLAAGEYQVCGRLVDRFDNRERRVGCQPIRYSRATESLELNGRRKEVLRRFNELETRELLVELDRLASIARSKDLPLFDVQLQLTAIHFLNHEGTPETLAEAERRLNALPPWIDDLLTGRHGASAVLERAFYQQNSKHLESAWKELGKARYRSQRLVDRTNLLAVAILESQILHQLGATGESVTRLRSALGECSGGCDAGLVVTAEGNLAWYVMLDPYSSDEDLDEAEDLSRAALARAGESNDLWEIANRKVNLAYLRVRRGDDPGDILRSVRETIDQLPLGTERGQRLFDWSVLVEGIAALAGGDAETALRLCGGLAGHDDSHFALWAASCVARAHRLRGDLAAAEDVFEHALPKHVYGEENRFHQGLVPGPGLRADAYSRTARIAIERGRPERAWALMLELDQLSVREAERRSCREKAQGPDHERWHQIDTEIESALADLHELGGPVSDQRRKEQETLVAERKNQLRELWREWPGCQGNVLVDDVGLEFRAFALEDEILLLHRLDDGKIVLEKRTKYAQQKLRLLQDQIQTAFERQDLDDDAWAKLLAPLAQALLPRDLKSVGQVTTYALHGLLQMAPLAMLPLPGEVEGRWFGQRTIPLIQPVGAHDELRQEVSARSPLFVVDPRSNLPATPQLLESYSRLFPNASFLVGEEATQEAFVREAAHAEWLHVDAHGLYDPAFPELSAIELADRPIHWVELADTTLSFRFAHLSGCQTGRWPVTADSGAYGIGGLVTRLGARWAIASRTDLDDGVAGDFNREFYISIKEGLSVPEAYHRAFLAVVDRHPAGAWGGLLLLRAAGAR